MWNRIYLVLLAVSVLVMGFFIYYAMSWLGSIGAPVDALAGFDYHYGILGVVLAVSTILLLIAANAAIWEKRQSWALWTTLFYFVLFFIVRSIWLGSERNDFVNENFEAGEGRWALRIALTVVVCLVAAAFTFADELLVVRMNERIYPPIEADIDAEVADDIDAAAAEDETEKAPDPS